MEALTFPAMLSSFKDIFVLAPQCSVVVAHLDISVTVVKRQFYWPNV
jgi:hypothetical protein